MRTRSTLLVGALFALAHSASTSANELAWVSPMRCRILLTVDPRGQQRSNSPASVDIDFNVALTAGSTMGSFDKHTIEVVAYDAGDAPKVFDTSREGDEKYLLPWRAETYYLSGRVTLSFVMPNHTCTKYAIYFDTVESRRGRPDRYPGIVGDGDLFTDGYHRREINSSGYDCFADIDGDGDLDVLKGGTEPYIFVYENVGQAKFVDRGRLTSNGNLFTVPYDGNHRSWHSVEGFDWDGDGDLDLFLYAPTGPDAARLVPYENTAAPGAPPVFVRRNPVRTVTNKSIPSSVTFVDWDGDGKLDLLAGVDSVVTFYRNIAAANSLSSFQLDDGAFVKANGENIKVMNPRSDCKDIDNDGDLDLFVGSEEGRIFFFENVGTRTAPVFAMGRLIAFYEFMDQRNGLRVADFDGDGLLDFIPGRYWERTQWGEQDRVFGRMYKNIGTTTIPKFEARDATNGAPYTLRFQLADAVRQNGVNAVDWNSDGKLDLLGSDTDGFVWFFRNTTNRLFPVFAPGAKLQAGGAPIRVYGEEREGRAAGYARSEITDWNNDGKKDLLVADGRGWLFLYLNQGTDGAPVLAAGIRVQANGKPIDGTARGSVIVCDWNQDGKKDVVFGMVGQGERSQFYDWPHQGPDPSEDRGFLFYRNTGTDAAPDLAFPTWIRSGPGSGSIINYSRPNLGDFIDWNGDGKKDFIGCEFENNCRVYINTSSGAANVEPKFESSANGMRIVQPLTVQTMSGADAIDWNGDGDIDVLTGQGHGGSGLRFYERDYINDYVNQYTNGNNTWPVVTQGASERKT